MVTKALVLGGGRWQVALIAKAKAMGLETVVADLSPAAPGRALADLFVELDTNNVNALRALGDLHGVSAILNDQTDRLVPVAAELCSARGLPGIPLEVAKRFSDKIAMRRALVDRGIPMPAFRVVHGLAEARAALAEVGLPAIVKPPNSQSSLGVSLLRNLAEAERAVAEAATVARGAPLLVEEFVDGTEVTVEAFSIAGRCHVLAVSEKAHYSHAPCVARWLAWPPRMPCEVIDRIETTAAKVVETLGLENGLSHAEYRVRDGVPHLVEVAARGGGNGIASVVVPHVSGWDVYDLLVASRLGRQNCAPPRAHRSAVLEFFDVTPGTVVEVHGVAAALREGLATAIDLPYQPGDRIERARDDRTRAGWFLALGADRDEVDWKAAEVKRRVRVETREAA